MLEKIQPEMQTSYMRFASIKRFATGKGRCFVYNVVLKRTKAGKPFVTMFLRDVEGVSIPGYVFDLKSPLLAGEEAKKAIGHIVEITWTENYLDRVGLTLILEDVAIVHSVPIAEQELFCGSVEKLEEKLNFLKSLVVKELGYTVTFPVTLRTYSSPDYVQGRVGGLLEYYYRIASILDLQHFVSKVERRQLIATFVVYTFVHFSYTKACDECNDDINLVTSLTEWVKEIDKQLKLGVAALEVVQMFFGYTPKDIYVRTVSEVANLVKRMDSEFAIYHTIPLRQEGNAGYGVIRRYQIEYDIKDGVEESNL